MSAAETALRSKGSLAWAYAMMISLSATLFSLQASEVSAQTYDFTFSGTYGSDTASITSGRITVDGIDKITSISWVGTAFPGLLGPCPSFSACTYNSLTTSPNIYHYISSTNYDFNVAINGSWQRFHLTSSGSYIDGIYSGAVGYTGTSDFSMNIAVPEIDGSVVPRAAFVMIGLFWIFKSRQRRLRLAEA